jgi:hypothetical protein
MISEKLSLNINTNNQEINFLNKEDQDYLIFVNIRKGKTERLFIKHESFLNKKIEDIQNEILKISNFYEADAENLKKVYFQTSGDINKIVTFISGNNFNLSALWSNLEDEVIISNDLDVIEEIIKIRGMEEVIKRRLFLKFFKESDFINKQKI